MRWNEKDGQWEVAYDHNDTTTWWYFEASNVANHIKKVEIETYKEYCQWFSGANHILLNLNITDEKEFKPFSFRWLTYVDKSGNEKCVLYNENAYLCTDEGKTIERLN